MTQIPPKNIFLSEQILQKSESKVGYEFVHPSEVCKELLEDPVTITHCQHTFCSVCLPDPESADEIPYCPERRTKFCPDHDVEPPSLFMKKTLAEIKLMCSFQECGKIVTYDLFQYHKDWGYCECSTYHQIVTLFYSLFGCFRFSNVQKANKKA